MLGLFAAGVFTRAVPGWLAWFALGLGIAVLTPFGFLASRLFLLWTAVAGIVLTVPSNDQVSTRVGVANPGRA
jgi:hypothetical protein